MEMGETRFILAGKQIQTDLGLPQRRRRCHHISRDLFRNTRRLAARQQVFMAASKLCVAFRTRSPLHQHFQFLFQTKCHPSRLNERSYGKVHEQNQTSVCKIDKQRLTSYNSPSAKTSHFFFNFSSLFFLYLFRFLFLFYIFSFLYSSLDISMSFFKGLLF